MVSAGEVTIFGTTRYEATNNACTVYADWNDIQPMQKVMPAGLNFTQYGRNSDDYSTWTFTYTSKYHLISEGINELTAKLSCDIGPFNATKDQFSKCYRYTYRRLKSGENKMDPNINGCFIPSKKVK